MYHSGVFYVQKVIVAPFSYALFFPLKYKFLNGRSARYSHKTTSMQQWEKNLHVVFIVSCIGRLCNKNLAHKENYYLMLSSNQQC